MLVLVRCKTCGKIIGNKWEYYLNRILEEKFKKEINLTNEDQEFLDLSLPELEKTISGKVLDELGFVRPCCRISFLTHIDLSEEISY